MNEIILTGIRTGRLAHCLCLSIKGHITKYFITILHLVKIFKTIFVIISKETRSTAVADYF